MKRMSKVYTALIFAFLFAPIVILLIFSFNEAKSLSVFSGFSLKWYRELLRDGETLISLKNTLILAFSASIISTVMGTAAAVGMHKMRSRYLRAAMDLGCTPLRAFFKVEIPEIMPGVITGLIMAFTLSLDDFVISYFTAGNGFQTLPIRIYNMTKKTVTPKMYALATIIFFVILALLLISNLFDSETSESVRKAKERKESHRRKQKLKEKTK